MEILKINGLPEGRAERPSVMALGNFDGLHIGHQQLICRAKELADASGLPASVLTFDPHPRVVLGRGHYNNLLTPFEEKMRVLEGLGVQTTYVVDFTTEFSTLTAEEFVFRFLAALNPQTVVVGFDYAFGRGGQADASLLKKLAEQIGIYVEIVGAVNRYGEKVSSTLIREKLSYGDMRLVHELLGRPYGVGGQVVHGEKRGRLLGFPTANIELSESYSLPKNGVYLVRVLIGGDYGGVWHAGVMNIGTKPTFHDQAHRSLEAHLFHFDGDIYGQPVYVEVLDFLRDEKKFFSIDELIAQIGADVQEAQARLAQYST
ncbi:bifunctional riboflavin kinase/FAD synthetase [Tumebacillus sp. ITR2]|uniref:Riboflavin biosynthesis protein n=1 Tax=Tumebacillus amylolyticus TaxID=2801339 RepID=A0ABS1JF86_9BACL|nr:bifunctional riboflavin kinase/FAD synthetase [Tumebacillus amylolyticus]MBL0388960.1 bifunctional riboflavin kinase/FAD synthetase [Tumebacillus amylolyticus]